MTVNVQSTAPPGQFSLIVNGTSGNLKRTATVGLNIQAVGDFAISPALPALTLSLGGSTSTNINISRSSGFSAPVTLTASGLPGGVLASFNPSSATGGSSTMTLTATSAVSQGTFPITITGTSGSLSHNATLTLTTTSVGNWFEAVRGLIK